MSFGALFEIAASRRKYDHQDRNLLILRTTKEIQETHLKNTKEIAKKNKYLGNVLDINYIKNMCRNIIQPL